MEKSAKCAQRNSAGRGGCNQKLPMKPNGSYYDSPPLQDLLHLKEIIARKYQRRRASIEDVASVNKLIEMQDAHD